MYKLYLNYFSCPAQALKAFRIAIAGLGIIDCIWRWTQVEEFYSQSGMVTCDLAWLTNALSGRIPTLSCISQSIYFQYALLILGMMALLSLALGRYARLSAFVTWLILISFDDRNPYVRLGEDNLLSVVLFWSMFIPWHQISLTSTSKPPPRWGSRLPCALVLLKCQILLMHAVTALAKTGPTWIKEFTAVETALSVDLYKTGLFDFVLNYPKLGSALTIFALGVEYIAPILLLAPANHNWGKKLRWCGISLFALLHVGIFLSLNIFIFQPLVIICLIPFVPPRLSVEPDPVAQTPFAKSLSSTSTAEFILIFLFVGVVVGTIDSIKKVSPTTLLNILHLKQTWPMFAPDPPPNVWPSATGFLANGDKIELISADFRKLDLRKRRFYVDAARGPLHGSVYAAYLCRQNKMIATKIKRFKKVIVYTVSKNFKEPLVVMSCED